MMTRSKKRFAKFLAFLMVTAIAVTSVNLSAFAQTETNGRIEEQNLIQTDGDNPFYLSNPDMYLTDDYNPEKIYEEEKANYAMNLLREQDRQEALNALSGDSQNTAPAAASIPGDPMVFYAQRWLNQEYGNVPGFGSVVENGKTGWNVINGLIRALQHELKIDELADSFGSETSKRYSQNPLYR